MTALESSSVRTTVPADQLFPVLLVVAVVGSAVGGVPELIDDGRTGRLFAAGDVEALAQCLRELIDHPELRQRFGEASAQRAADEFRMELNKDRTQALYDRLLN